MGKDSKCFTSNFYKFSYKIQFFVLEMIEEIVRKFHKLFKSHDEFKSIIIDKILPMIKRLPKSEEFVETLRLCQMSLSLCQFYFEIMVRMKMFKKLKE
jgi:hypothetical protein